MTTQRPPIIQPRPASPTTIIRFNGASYVKFDFSQLPSQYLTYSPDEEFSFWFLTDQPEGLLWYHQEPKRNLYLAIKVDKNITILTVKHLLTKIIAKREKMLCVHTLIHMHSVHMHEYVCEVREKIILDYMVLEGSKYSFINFK